MKKFLLSILIVSTAATSVAQWVQSNTGIINSAANQQNINAIAALGTTIFAGGDKGLFISTDNGDNWSLSSHADLNGSGEIKALLTIGDKIFAGVYGGKGVLLSTDSGTTWTAKNSGLSIKYCSALVAEGNTIYATLDFEGLYTSTDFGDTWTKITSAPLAGLKVTGIVVSGSVILAGTNKNDNGVLASNDGGTTWIASNTGITDLDINALTKIGSTIFAATGSGIFKSTDDGATWALTTTTGGIVDNAISMIPLGSTLLAGTPKGTYSTNDNGVTWTNVTPNATISSLVATGFAANSTTLFVSNTFLPVGVWKRPLSDFGMTTGMSVNTKDEINLYPNPANDQLIIEIPSVNNSTIQIFDMQGKQIRSFRPTEYKSAISVQNIPAGVYTVKITDALGVKVEKLIKE